jgi:predicted DNA-binding protein (UPF0251 family)
MQNKPDNKYISFNEAGKLLGVQPNVVQYHLERGRFQAVEETIVQRKILRKSFMEFASGFEKGMRRESK